MKWISVKERLPEKEGDYLVCIFVISMNPHRIVRVSHGKPYKLENKFNGHVYDNFGWSGCNSELKVTHWAKLPEPPKEEE